MKLFNVELYASIILVDKHKIIHNFMNIKLKQMMNILIQFTAQDL